MSLLERQESCRALHWVCEYSKKGVKAVLVSRRSGPQLLEVEGYWDAMS